MAEAIDYKHIGSRPVRPDGVDKVTGRAEFGGDVSLPGMIIGKILRSPHAHARIKSIDITDALAIPGVHAVITGADFPGGGISGEIDGEGGGSISDQAKNVIARDKVLYHGHALAAVAAISDTAADRALDAIKVEYEVLSPVLDILEAIDPDSALVNENNYTKLPEKPDRPSNIANVGNLVRGDIQEGFERADVIIEREYVCPMTHQGYIEPHSCLASVDEEGKGTVWCSTQGHFEFRNQTASILKKNIADLKFGNKLDVDIVAVSFVRDANDIIKVREIVDKNIKIIAKIELKNAVKNLDSIIDEADGVMVARGDLGVQLDLEKVPFIQKQILNEANAKGKITVTATEMLQSMKESHRPTRAEVTDITNAILEGTDCVMLSAETAIGNHPEVVVSAMSDICKEADSRNDTSVLRFKETSTVDTLTTSLAKAAVQVANEIEAKAIVAFTETGRTPLLISNYRPEAPIFTMTTIDKTYNQMNILWGVQQIKIDRLETTPEMFEIADTWLQNNKKFKKNDKVVIVAGTPPNKEAATNLIRVMKIGEF